MIIPHGSISWSLGKLYGVTSKFIINRFVGILNWTGLVQCPQRGMTSWWNPLEEIDSHITPTTAFHTECLTKIGSKIINEAEWDQHKGRERDWDSERKKEKGRKLNKKETIVRVQVTSLIRSDNAPRSARAGRTVHAGDAVWGCDHVDLWQKCDTKASMRLPLGKDQQDR